MVRMNVDGTVDAFKRDCFCNQLFIVLNLSRNAFISCHVNLESLYFYMCIIRLHVLVYKFLKICLNFKEAVSSPLLPGLIKLTIYFVFQ